MNARARAALAGIRRMPSSGRGTVASSMDRLRRSAAGWNWPVIILVLGCALVTPWRQLLGLLGPGFLWLPGGPFAAYEAALRAAAIKTPEDQKVLRRIEGDSIQFVSFRATPLPAGIDGKLTLNGPLWVALADELRAACHDADESPLRLEQILGLPPRHGDWQLYPVTASASQVFRPCMSGDAPSASSCSFDMPSDPTQAKPADEAMKAEVDKLSKEEYVERSKQEYDRLQEEYRRLRFVASQMWNVYRAGFPDPRAAPDDYAYTGYPFTAMGWTYNWNPVARSHAGVSEFVMGKGQTVTVGAPVDPSIFCASTPSAQTGTPATASH
jgi:hypothetical protein